MSDTKSFLIVNRRSPYQTHASKEAVDVALTCAVFNQPTRVLFMDDGVYQLVKQQDPSDIDQKNNAATFPMLEMYDVKSVYVEEVSLVERGLSEQDLMIPVEVISSAQVSELLESQQVVLGF